MLRHSRFATARRRSSACSHSARTADDIEIGCGATMLALTRSREVEVTWVVLGADGVRETEARASADAFLSTRRPSRRRAIEFRDGYFPYVGGEVKDVFEELKADGRSRPRSSPTRAHDLHQDHRLVCELTWNTWRDHLDPRVRDSEVRRRPRHAERLRPGRRRNSRARRRDLLERAFASQRDEALVRRRAVPGSHAPARGGSARRRAGTRRRSSVASSSLSWSASE